MAAAPIRLSLFEAQILKSAAGYLDRRLQILGDAQREWQKHNGQAVGPMVGVLDRIGYRLDLLADLWQRIMQLELRNPVDPQDVFQLGKNLHFVYSGLTDWTADDSRVWRALYIKYKHLVTRCPGRLHDVEGGEADGANVWQGPFNDGPESQTAFGH